MKYESHQLKLGDRGKILMIFCIHLLLINRQTYSFHIMKTQIGNNYPRLIIPLLFMLFFQQCRPRGDQKSVVDRPNIIFILVDDLGKEWVSTYGADDIRTPNVDKLADSGLKFINVYSNPQCTPTRVALLTGQYPWRNGWINHYDVPRWGNRAQFDPEFYTTFAEILKGAGYVTCVAGKWQINDFRVQPDVMVRHGFDEYCMWTGGEGGNIEVSQKRYWDPYIHTKAGSKTYTGQFGDDIFTDFIIRFMGRNKEKPMMIYYPMCLTHGPFTTTPLEPQATGKIGKFKAMVSYTDFLLGKLISALDSLGIRDRTIVFWTTDNGTSTTITGHRNGQAVRGGKSYLTENGIAEPFIVNCPGLVPEGKVTNELVDFTDLLPTFVELAVAEIPAGDTIDGHSIAPLIFGRENDSPRDWIMAMGSHPAVIRNGRVENFFTFRDRVIRDKEYKVFVDTAKAVSGLYDLRSDPGEDNNLAGTDDPYIKKVMEEFAAVIRKLPNKDANPKYKKLNKSYYDIPVDDLYDLSIKLNHLSNKAPKPEQ